LESRPAGPRRGLRTCAAAVAIVFLGLPACSTGDRGNEGARTVEPANYLIPSRAPDGLTVSRIRRAQRADPYGPLGPVKVYGSTEVDDPFSEALFVVTTSPKDPSGIWNGS
jgi:hypothetical protein